MTEKDYPYIRAWGNLEDVVQQARREKAPEDALYRKQNGIWITTKNITPVALSTLNRRIKLYQ